MIAARIPMVGDFSCVSEGDLTVWEPGVFGFVAYEGDYRVFVVQVFLYIKKNKYLLAISSKCFVW